jgi:hypothetical protein
MIVIRPAISHDAPAIAVVQVETWQTAYRGVVTDDFLDQMSVEDRANRWSEILQKPNTITFVAENDGQQIIGFGTIPKNGSNCRAVVWRKSGTRRIMAKKLDDLKTALFWLIGEMRVSFALRVDKPVSLRVCSKHPQTRRNRHVHEFVVSWVGDSRLPLFENPL